MKKILSFAVFVALAFTSRTQFVARMEVKTPIQGLCDSKNVIVAFPGFKGQKAAECPVTKDSIEKRLNAEVVFLKDSTGYNDKGMVNVIINCKGVVVQCEMDKKTRHPELDIQVVAVFNSLGVWKAATLNKKAVDSLGIWSFEIKDGKIIVE